MSIWREGALWSPEEDAYLKANSERLDFDRIAEELGRTRGAVYQRARKLALPCSFPKPAQAPKLTYAESEALNDLRILRQTIARCMREERVA